MTKSPFIAPVNTTLLDQAGYLVRKIVPGLRRRLVNRVGTEIGVELQETTSSTIGEQLDVMGSRPAALATLEIPGGRMAVVLEGSLLSKLLARMLGGDPSTEEEEDDRAALTRIDLRVGSRLCEDLAETLGEQLGFQVTVFDVRPAPRSLVWSTRSTKVVTVPMRFGPEDNPFGMATLVVPLPVCNTLFGTTGLPTNRAVAVDRVLPLEVEVIAELARIPLVVADLQHLEVGSMLDLGSASEIVLSVNGKPTLLAEAGEADGVRSIRVLRRLGVPGS